MQPTNLSGISQISGLLLGAGSVSKVVAIPHQHQPALGFERLCTDPVVRSRSRCSLGLSPLAYTI
jgi:hypothetical protein